jgi:hypothetical protein
MTRYNCKVTSADTLRAYETEDNEPVEHLFALVIENPMTKDKASVLLDKQACVRLAAQLLNFAKD